MIPLRSYPTLLQFSEHPCTNWEMRELEEYCVRFGKALDDLELHCNPRCPAYDPWDLTVEELLEEDLPVDGENHKNGGAS